MGVREEKSLDANLPEDTQLLLDLDDLQRMFAGDVHSAFLECHRSKSTAQLVGLQSLLELFGRARVLQPPHCLLTQ